MLYLTVCDVCWKSVWTNGTREWKFCLHLKISGNNYIFKVARSLDRPNFVRWRLLYCGTGCMLRGIVGRFLDFGETLEPLHLHNFSVQEEQFNVVK